MALPHWTFTEEEPSGYWLWYCRCGAQEGGYLSHRQATGYARGHRDETQREQDEYIKQTAKDSQ